MSRTCQINHSGAMISIKLSVNNALISGGDFKVYDFNSGIINENFKLHTGNSGVDSYTILIKPSDLGGQVLSWHILTCSPVITNSGILSVEVFQNEELCLTDPLARYNLNNVPDCSVSHAFAIQGGLHFI